MSMERTAESGLDRPQSGRQKMRDAYVENESSKNSKVMEDLLKQFGSGNKTSSEVREALIANIDRILETVAKVKD